MLTSPARSTDTCGWDSSTWAAVTPPQLVASVPSMRASALREPSVAPITLAPAAALARLTTSPRVSVRAAPSGRTVMVHRVKPRSGETATMSYVPGVKDAVAPRSVAGSVSATGVTRAS